MSRAVLLLLVACAGRPAATVSAGPRPPDGLARAFALRAWVAEARGDAEEARRSWLWVERLDGGADARRHRGDALSRLGDPDAARVAYTEALERDAGHPDARLGLALLDGDQATLGEIAAHRPCRVAGAGTGGVRRDAEAACVAR